MIHVGVEIEEVGHVDVLSTEGVLVRVGAPRERRRRTRGEGLSPVVMGKCRGLWGSTLLVITEVGVRVAYWKWMAVLVGDVDQHPVHAEAHPLIGVATLQAAQKA